MKKIRIQALSVLLVLMLLVSSTFSLYVSAADAPLTYSSQYNSGSRDVVCTTLDGTSASSYYKNHDYDDLSEMDASALFSSLQSLMRSTHTYTASYDDCHYKADRTDCTNGSANVSLIYTSYSATMSQWNGWNREHVWPQSLGGDNTNGGGADLHHIRPSDAVVNSTRSNRKYGEVVGGTSCTGRTPAAGYAAGTYGGNFYEPLDNVKGDVARICLYVYVRWNSQWGASNITSVFESVDVLLEWCELDPVDTWEMGRNEVIEDIQGNRNVFIDYPEYAWLIFGREVPSDMTTPSGEAKGTSGSQGGTTTPPESGDEGGTTNPPTGGEQGGTTTPPESGEQGGTTTPPESGEQGGTTNPPAGETGSTLIDATITNSIPSGLTYITNNSDYPDPGFYSAGGLKMNFVNMGVQTSAFAAQSSVKVTINVNALNENSKSDTGADVFTVYGLDASGNVVATATYDAVAVGENVVILNGEGIVSVKVIMTNYAHNGNKFCNIGLSGIKVEALTEGGEQGGTTTPPESGEQGGTTTPPEGGEEGGTTNPPAGVTGSTLIDATITNSIPSELTYITNNSDYPDPGFYSAGGLKLNFVNMGVQTSAFASQSSVKVTINVNALNENSKSGTDADVFTVYGLDASGNVVATATYDAVAVGENVVILNGEGIVSVKVIMTNYAHNGNKFCNIGLSGIKVEALTEGGEQGGTTTPPESGEQGGTTTPPESGEQGGTTTPPESGEQGGTTNPPESGEQGGTITPPESGDEGGATNPPAGGDQGEVTDPSTGDDQGDKEAGDCEHTFGEWEAIGSDAGFSRSCSKCGTYEFSMQIETDEIEKRGCDSVIGTAGALIALIPMLGVAFVMRKKED